MKKLFIYSTIIFLFFILACSGDDDGDENKDLDYETFYTSFANEYCTSIFACCTDGVKEGLPFKSEDECKQVYKTYLAENKLDETRFTWNQDAAQKCFDSYMKTYGDVACDQDMQSLKRDDDFQQCFALLEPIVEEGGVCNNSEFPTGCKDGLYCATDNICKKIVDSGKECSTAEIAACAAGTYCHPEKNTCQPFMKKGEQCDNVTAFCSLELYCDTETGFCTMRKEIGDDCIDSWECDSMLCLDGKCDTEVTTMNSSFCK